MISGPFYRQEAEREDEEERRYPAEKMSKESCAPGSVIERGGEAKDYSADRDRVVVGVRVSVCPRTRAH